MVKVRVTPEEVRLIPRGAFDRLARYLGCSTPFVITQATDRAKRNPPVRRGRRTK